MVFHVDHCDHEKQHPGSYQGSFQRKVPLGEQCIQYDVYFYPTNHGSRYEKDICIRYGSEGHEYISPGPIEHVEQAVAKFPDLHSYRIALNLINKTL